MYIIESLKPDKRKPYWYRMRLQKSDDSSVPDGSNLVVDVFYNDLVRYSLDSLLKTSSSTDAPQNELGEVSIPDHVVGEINKASLKRILRDKALNKIAFKSQSTGELSRFLKNLIFTKYRGIFDEEEEESVIASIISGMEEKNYLNDESFSKSLVKKRVSQHKPLGRRAIMQELYSKGISSQNAKDVLDSITEGDELENASRYLSSIRNAVQMDRNKLISRLLSRGFSYATANTAVNRIFQN